MANDATPVTMLPLDVRLSRVESDLVTIGILSIITALHRMKSFLQIIYERRVPPGALEPDDMELTLLFNDAWIIVDRLDLLRRVLKLRLIKVPPDTDAGRFWSALQNIRIVRNRMEHIDLKHIARKTSSADFPILGVITAVMFKPSELVDGKLTTLDSVVLSHSDFHAKINLMTVPEDFFPLTPPVDHIRLHAFETIVNLSKLVALAEGFTDVLKQRETQPPSAGTRLKVVVTAHFDPPWLLIPG